MATAKEPGPRLNIADQEATRQTSCYHCSLPVPDGTDYQVTILGEPRRMCCRGCEAVARSIVSSGLEDYYRFRTAPSGQGHEPVPDALRETLVYDNPQIQKSFVTRGQGESREASLILEGITCAACVWLNEQHLASLPGVMDVSINYSTHRARVRWDEGRTHLSDILDAIAAIGYHAHPYDPGRHQELLEQERKTHLRRLAIAGALGMQIMTIAVALYFGASHGMDPAYRSFFHWVGLVLCIPVVTYAAAPFYRAAWRDLRSGTVGMDVPVSLGILGAFTASAWATISGQGHVYFESAAMFVFFLLTARYFELEGRRRSTYAMERLVRMTPTLGHRLRPMDGEETEEVVPVAELAPGDRVRVRPGETVPADGRIVEGTSSVDESLLTGESIPVEKTAGETLIGGSINVEGPLIMVVDKVGQDTVLSGILRLLDRAQTEKPAISLLANRVASWFVAGVLVLAAATGMYWWITAPQAWFEIVISVLVVTCPCALSLATPTAVTAATGALAQLGMLTTRGHALETLAQATHMGFDKTGTLTRGRLRLLSMETFNGISRDEALRLAGALERHSEHPLARALLESGKGAGVPATAVRNTPGGGLEGVIEGRKVCIGSPQFVLETCGARALALTARTWLSRPGTIVFLAAPGQALAVFELGDEMREDAPEAIATLREDGLEVFILSGDQPGAARALACQVGIDPGRSLGGLHPDDKLGHVRALQEQGAVVAMVGDGINDAPVLAGAQVSIAVGSGAQLALASADMIMLGQRLGVLGKARRVARRTRRIIWQNLAWAIAYNVIALPAAAAGFVTPWLAALGMSASSLVVVANALRLTRMR